MAGVTGLSVQEARARIPDRELPPPQLSEVALGVLAYVQPDGSWMINNTGALVGRTSTLLVDTTSTEVRNRALLAAVGEATCDRPVRTVVNTHHHGDHTFGNWLLGAGADIVGSTACRQEVLRAGFIASTLFLADYGHQELAPPTVTFSDRLTLWVDERPVELTFVGPAHTLGDVIVWLPDRRVVFSGDLVFSGGHPFLVEGSLRGFPPAIEAIRFLGADVLVPGHGPVARGADVERVLAEMTAYGEFVTVLAGESHAAGCAPLEAARRAELGPFAAWQEPERLVGNPHLAYAEIENRSLGGITAVIPDMIAFNGGPLRCLA